MLFQLHPFALSIGPQRAATSWVDRYLRARGDVCLPGEIKEVFFFDRHYHKGPEFYKGHFDPGPEHDLVMEVSATYFDTPEAPERVKETLGEDLRFICPLREPIARSYSLYKHYLRYGIVSGSLEEAIRQKPQIVESSCYADHLKRWCDVFGRERITLLFQEELESDPDSFVAHLCAGLDITFKPVPDSMQKRINQMTQAPSRRLASAAQNTADFFRDRGVYWPMNAAKALGLKKFVFGKEGGERQGVAMAEADRRCLSHYLGEEKRKLEDLIGKPVELW